MFVIFDNLNCEFENRFVEDEVFDDLFDNSSDGKLFVVHGTLGLWDGKEKCHSPLLFNSLKDAIIKCNDGFDGFLRVYEADYGKLFVEVVHHDGTNVLEVRELNKLGERLNSRDYSVGEILKRTGATRNVQFTKRYLNNGGV